MVLSNQKGTLLPITHIGLNGFIAHLADKHKLDLSKELSEYVVTNTPEHNKHKIQFVFIAIAEISGVPLQHLLGKCRKREFIDWKHIARYICIMNRYGTLQYIATELNCMDHSSLIHSRNLVNDLLDSGDREMTYKYNLVKHLINETNKEKKDVNSIGIN